MVYEIFSQLQVFFRGKDYNFVGWIPSSKLPALAAHLLPAPRNYSVLVHSLYNIYQVLAMNK